MASKRQPDLEGSDRSVQIPVQELKRRHGNSNQAELFHALRNLRFPSWMISDFQSCLEPLIQRVLQEEVLPIIQRHLCQSCRTMLNKTERSGGRAFQLCFLNRLPPTIFTFSKLTAEDGAPLKIALLDATSQYVTATNGPLSSIKVEIYPLKGEFDSDDWTANEFNANILRERENKGPLLSGDKLVILKNGIGLIPRIVFTDNSSWGRSGKFRIGAKIAGPISDEAINIREARSDPFRVKDNRGEAYKKHDCPTLNDPIWRLNRIRKDGKTYKHLSSYGIVTVRDLLQMQTANPALFEQIFVDVSRKSREIIMEHAKACREEDKRFGQPVVLERELHPLKDSMAVDEASPHSLMNPFATNLQVQVAAQSSNPDQGLQQFVIAQQGLQAGMYADLDQPLQQSVLPTFEQGQSAETWNQPSTSTAQVGEAALICTDPTAELIEMEKMLQNSFSGGLFSSEWDPNVFFPESQFNIPNHVSSAQTWGQDKGFHCVAESSRRYSNFAASSAVDVSSTGKFKRGWLTALIWVISIRRCAARKREQLFLHNYEIFAN